MNNFRQMQFTENQINGLKAGLSDIIQGCITLNKTLTMIRIPESAKFPEGKETIEHAVALHDAHVRVHQEHLLQKDGI